MDARSERPWKGRRYPAKPKPSHAWEKRGRLQRVGKGDGRPRPPKHSRRASASHEHAAGSSDEHGAELSAAFGPEDYV
eukprot:180946-Alexandrium_andersonii.AAC.1